MAYREILEKVYAENVPFSVLLELTYQCNLDCVFCYNDLGLKGKALSVDQYITLFSDLAAMGTMNMTLSGGEPLAHPDFFRIGAEARKAGFVVRVKSNGHGLRGGVLRRLREEIDPFYVEMSMHGANAATHDRQTRVPGSFERLMSNLQAMADEGLRFRLKTPVTRWNEEELEGMFAIADRFGVPLDCDPQITPRDDGDPSPMGLAPSPDGVKNLFRILEQRRLAKLENVPGADRRDTQKKNTIPRKHCGAGSSGVTVDPVGNVLACVQWRRPVGNLHQQSIRDIWASSQALGQIRRKSEEVAQFVRNAGPLVKRAGYCPASAEQQTGSHVQLYPSVLRSMGGLEVLGKPGSENTFERRVALDAGPQPPVSVSDESAAGEG